MQVPKKKWLSKKDENAEQHVGWEGVHVTFVKNYDKEKDDLKDLNLLDSDSNTTVFCKQEYVKKYMPYRWGHGSQQKL